MAPSPFHRYGQHLINRGANGLPSRSPLVRLPPCVIAPPLQRHQDIKLLLLQQPLPPRLSLGWFDPMIRQSGAYRSRYDLPRSHPDMWMDHHQCMEATHHRFRPLFLPLSRVSLPLADSWVRLPSRRQSVGDYY